MKIIGIALALIPSLLSTSLVETPGFQNPATAPKPRIQINAVYDKKRDVTKLFLPPLILASNRNPGQFEQVRLIVGFECPSTKIVRPKEVLFTFSATSQNFVSFPSLEFSVSIDGTLLELGKLKGSQRKQIYAPSMTVYEDESIAITYDNFTRIVTAEKVTLIIGKRNFELSGGEIQWIGELHKLMQREGEEIK